MTCRVLLDLRRLGPKVVLLASIVGGLPAPHAFAQDALRGSLVTGPAYMNWRGVYGGAQASYNNGDVDFGSATAPLTNFILRDSSLLNTVSDWTTLPNGTNTNSSFGGFIGYNWQWDDMVIGLEGNYSRTRLNQSSADSLSRSFIDNNQAPPGFTYTYNMTVAGNSTVTLTDLATFRARAGWAVGTLMPYGFIGFAVGRADVTSTATVSGTRDEFDGVTTTNVVLALPGPQTNARKGVFAYGGAVGLGFDWALTQNLFLRGEYELVQLNDIEGIEMRINTGRVALGLKF